MRSLGCGAGFGAAVLVCGLAVGVVPANAQSNDAPNTAAPDTTAPTGKPPAPSPQAPPTPSTAQPAPGPFAGITAFGQNLANKGVYLTLGYVEDFSAAVSGGLKTGVMPTGELFFGTTLDLQKILGIRGASFHVVLDERNGEPVSPLVGTQGPLQANSGPDRAIRLSEFFWEQGFDGDRYDITIGRTNPTLDFATSDIACQFVGSIICAQPGSWYFSNANNAYPSSTWGGRFNIAVTPNVYIRAGAFDDDPSQNLPNQQGFNWNVRGSTGVFVPAEVGYTTTFSSARYPVKYDVGGYYDTASFTYPNGGPTQNDRTAVYAQGVQTVWRPNPNTQQSLQVFAGGIVYGRGAPYWGQYYGGLFDRAPVPWRPDDTIGFIGSYYPMNSAYLPNRPSQWIFELNYGYQLYSGITVKPYAQFIVHPNNVGAGLPNTLQPGNAWVIGFQVSINVGQLFKFPQFVAY